MWPNLTGGGEGFEGEVDKMTYEPIPQEIKKAVERAAREYDKEVESERVDKSLSALLKEIRGGNP